MPYPDIQFHFLPLAVTYDGIFARPRARLPGACRADALEEPRLVRLASRDPRDKPKIRFNYLSHPDDWTEMRACVRLTREIFAQPAFDPYRGREIQPGADVQTDERSTPSSAQRPRAPITRPAPAGWVGATIRWPWSTPKRG